MEEQGEEPRERNPGHDAPRKSGQVRVESLPFHSGQRFKQCNRVDTLPENFESVGFQRDSRVTLNVSAHEGISQS